MDAVNGLTDTVHNPRAAFGVYRSFNGILFPEKAVRHASNDFAVSRICGTLYAITAGDRKFGLVLDAAALSSIPESWTLTTLWDLCRGQSRDWSAEHPVQIPFLITYTDNPVN